MDETKLAIESITPQSQSQVQTPTPTPTKNHHKRSCLFQEIISDRPEPIDLLPDQVEVYVSKVQPKQCGKLIKELGHLLPLVKFDDRACSHSWSVAVAVAAAVAVDDDDSSTKLEQERYVWPPLGHLRRVKRTTEKDGEDADSKTPNNPSEGTSCTRTSVEEIGKEARNEPPKKRKRLKKNKNGNNNGKNNNKNKNNNCSVELELLFGSVVQIDSILNSSSDDVLHDDANYSDPNPNEASTKLKSKLNELLKSNQLQLLKKKLPGRPAKSQAELQDWKRNWWPTHYFEKQSAEYRTKELALDIDDEWGYMRSNLLAAVEDAKHYRAEHVVNVNGNVNANGNFFHGHGAVAYCPKSQSIVSKSHDEWLAKIRETSTTTTLNSSHQSESTVKRLLLENPLNTPVLLCIQGVSRKEREAAMGKGMDSESFKEGQYLCTG